MPVNESSRKRRRPWLAALLSLFGAPIGHVYCGRLRRAAGFWLAGMLLVPLIAFCWVTFPVGRLGNLALTGVAIAFPFVQAMDAMLVAWKTRESVLGRIQQWWIYLLLVVAAYPLNYGIAILVKTYIAEAFMVPTRAMAPTIQPGDRIIVDKLWTNPARLKRKDIVVYRSVGQDSQLHVMRVLSLAGDRITIEESKIFVNDQEIEVAEAHEDGPAPPNFENDRIFGRVIADQSFFVVGDNRNMAYDSRYVGAIPNRNLYGTAISIFWSQPRIFPDPTDTSRFRLAPIAWERLGLPLRESHR